MTTDSQPQQGADQPNAEAPKKPRFSPDERNAMRAYLQRSEVRLSTMHRIAVGFLGGAGLLFLLPVFLKDGVLILIRSMLDFASVSGLSAISSPEQIGITIVLYICLIVPFLISVTIPAIALLLLLKDIARFYFTGHPPGFPSDLFNPRLVLTGIAFSPDESKEVKERVLRYQYGSDLINFVLSHDDARSGYYYDIIDKPERMIIPRTRKLPRLVKMGIVDVPSGKPLDELGDNDVVRVHGTYKNGDVEESLLREPFVQRSLREIDGFNAALGLAGHVDRSLYKEVAKTEVSLVRHALNLRRLVLRYFQALLILIWTSSVTFAMVPFLQDTHVLFSLPVIFAVAYVVWAALAPFIVSLPIYWLASASKPEIRRTSLRQLQKSDAIQRFASLTQRLCYIALASASMAVILEIVLLMGN